MANIERFLNGEHFYLPNSDVLYSYSDNVISGFCGGVLGYSIVKHINSVGFMLEDAKVYCFAFIRFKEDENAIGEPVIGTTDENQLNSLQTN